MSLSNEQNEEFQAFDVTRLESYDQEQSNRTEESKPDFERFDLLFEKPKFESEETLDFKSLIDRNEPEEESVFEPLIKREEDQTPPADQNGKTENKTAAGDSGPAEEPPPPEPTPEEIGYQEGYDKGFAQGMTQGEEKGYQEGFERGQTEGLETGREEGFAKGQEEGLAQGLATGAEQADREAREKAEQMLAAMSQELEQINGMKEKLVDIYEDRLISLVCSIAEKAVMTSLEIDNEIVRPVVLDALKKLIEPEEVVLSVSETDFDYIEMVKDDFFEQIESLQHISVRSDPAISPGGCRIESNTATIQTDPAAKLEAIVEAVKQANTRTV